MTIREIIEKIKANHHGVTRDGTVLNETNTKDKILYGNPDVECTGIVTCIYASVDVIKEATRLGANLIVSHEACFWNHGDHTEWLADNKAFQGKKRLLDEAGIVVWRDHDYIHSGINVDGKWVDGIFYGLMQELGWEAYLNDDIAHPMTFKIPETTGEQLAEELMEKMNLDSIRVLGDPTRKITSIHLPIHILGPVDNAVIKKVNDEDIDALMTMECTDYTVAIYMRDAAMLGLNKTVLAVGHFNVEEPGMKYFADFLPGMIGTDLPVTFVKAGDSYKVITRK